MTPRGDTNYALRAALLALLAAGQPLTTTELRDRLQNPTLTQETVYRHLDALTRDGQIRRIRPPGRRYVLWARRPSGAVSASHTLGGTPRVVGLRGPRRTGTSPLDTGTRQ